MTRCFKEANEMYDFMVEDTVKELKEAAALHSHLELFVSNLSPGQRELCKTDIAEAKEKLKCIVSWQPSPSCCHSSPEARLRCSRCSWCANASQPAAALTLDDQEAKISGVLDAADFVKDSMRAMKSLLSLHAEEAELAALSMGSSSTASAAAGAAASSRPSTPPTSGATQVSSISHHK